MKKFTIALAAATAIVSGAAFAQMTAVEDEVLSTQTGQDGVSIALNIKAHIDAFEWIDTDSGGGAMRFEDIAIGSGALTSSAAGTYMGLNGNGANDVIAMGARHDYQTGIQFGGPINIDVEDVGNFSAAAAGMIAKAGGSDLTYDGGYTVHVPTAGTKAVVIGLPRMVMSFNVGAMRVVNATAAGTDAIANNKQGGAEAYSMGGLRVTNFDLSSTKLMIWGHK